MSGRSAGVPPGSERATRAEHVLPLGGVGAGVTGRHLTADVQVAQHEDVVGPGRVPDATGQPHELLELVAADVGVDIVGVVVGLQVRERHHQVAPAGRAHHDSGRPLGAQRVDALRRAVAAEGPVGRTTLQLEAPQLQAAGDEQPAVVQQGAQRADEVAVDVREGDPVGVMSQGIGCGLPGGVRSSAPKPWRTQG